MNKIAFTFDDVSVTPDCQIGKHSHQRWELSHIICGKGSRTIGDLTEPMTEGEIILVPPGLSHCWNFDPHHTDDSGKIANITILFETSTLDGLLLIIPELESAINKIKSLTAAVKFTDNAYRRLHELLMAMRGATPAARVPRMIELLQVIADAENNVNAGHSNTLSRTEQRLENVRTFCYCNFTREITLEEMAAYAGMNKSAFCTFMRRHAGATLSEFVNNIRLEKALEMLRHTDKTIATIAYDSGFSNVTYFNRLFRRKYNTTPKSLRTPPSPNL